MMKEQTCCTCPTITMTYRALMLERITAIAYAIEELPASEQQTKISLMVAALKLDLSAGPRKEFDTNVKLNSEACVRCGKSFSQHFLSNGAFRCHPRGSKDETKFEPVTEKEDSKEIVRLRKSVEKGKAETTSESDCIPLFCDTCHATTSHRLGGTGELVCNVCDCYQCGPSVIEKHYSDCADYKRAEKYCKGCGHIQHTGTCNAGMVDEHGETYECSCPCTKPRETHVIGDFRNIVVKDFTLIELLQLINCFFYCLIEHHPDMENLAKRINHKMVQLQEGK